MKRLLSIAVLAIGMSASLAHAQEVKADKQDAISLTAVDSQTSAQQSTIAEANAVTAKESLVQKALSVGGSLHARIDHAKDTLKSSFTGGLKEKFANAQNTWQAGKHEWESANAKQDSQSVNVSTEKVEERLRTSYY